MKSTIINSIIYLLIGFSLLNCIPAEQAASMSDHEDEITLKIEKDREDGMIRFSITNKGSKEVLTTPVGTNHSRVSLISSSRKTIHHYSTMDIIPTRIQPGETIVWKENIKPVLAHYGLENEKDLQLVWTVNGIKSAPFILNQRN